MEEDYEGFKQPLIDLSVCIKCGQCESVCPVLHPNESREPLAVYTAKALDNNIRMKSSSGGLFTIIAEEILQKKGVVYGAGWDYEDMRVVHKSVEERENLEELRGSKYVQSDMSDIFVSVKSMLETKRLVLFSGCPCQVAGLKRFLATDYTNLCCIDFICHAISSPKAFDLYKKNQEQIHKSQLSSVFFRNKENGWRQSSIALSFDNGLRYREVAAKDAYLLGFLSELLNRRSCHDCKFRKLRSGADITLGDFWGVEHEFPKLDDDKGISLLMLNTEKGLNLFSEISKRIEFYETDYNSACKYNLAAVNSPLPHNRRNKFFVSMKPDDIIADIYKALRPTIYRRCRMFTGRLLRKLQTNVFFG